MTIISCKICEKLGKELNVDYLEGEKFPEERQLLTPVPETDDSVFQCPVCEQYYVYYRNYDNDVYNLFDYAVLYQVDENRVNEIIDIQRKNAKQEKQKINRFRYKARKKFRFLHDNLSADERKLYDYLTFKTVFGEYIKTISNDLSISLLDLIKIVENLENKGLINKQIIYPLSVGEHNFQEAVTDVDPLDYTKVNIRMF